MTKYISVFEPVGDGTKDRGEKQYCLVCSDEGVRKAKGIGSHVTVEDYPLSKILRVDCFRKGEPKSHTGEGAAAGFLLGGVKGAMIGGMLSSGETVPWWIEIELKDHTVRCFRCYRDSDHEVFLKWADKCGVKVEAAEAGDAADEFFDDVDEILRYKQLLDQGILTQEEFDAKKKQILKL